MAPVPSVTTLTPAAASTTAYASAVTGASFTLTHTSVDNLGRQILFTNNSSNDKSGINMVLVGTDADGNAQTETLPGPGASTTTVSVLFYKTLTSVTPASTFGADTMKIGTNGVWSGSTIPLNARNANAAVVVARLSGTCTFTVQQTYDSVLQNGVLPAQSSTWSDISALATKSATTVGAAATGATAIRLLSASYSTGAVLSLSINQPWTTIRA